MTSTYAETRAIAVAAGYDRILVDGVDVTYFRDKRTPTPSYLLTEPFAYGSATLELPQVHAYEDLGTGDLSWVRKGAPVIIQRVDDPNAETPIVLATDYRGFVVCPTVEGRSVLLEIAGEFAGKAALINRQTPLVRRVKDVGFWAAYVFQTLGLYTADRDGPTTGVDLAESGGVSLLAYAQDVCAYSQGDDGAQWTMMPTVHGGIEWELRLKDYTTKHATIFTDDTRAAVSLRDDLAEQPNTWFGTGITPDGVRIRNGRYPGLIQGPAPEYPGSMTLGDVDADTTTGDGVSVLNYKLAAMGYVAITQSFDYTVFSAATAAGVRALQREAGLTVNGTVNEATFNALFDISATGWELTDSKIHPLVQDDSVRMFDYTANGSIAGLNPAYDRTATRVDRNIDFGAGVTKPTMIGYCRGQSARLAGKNWTGTITLNGASAWTGERDSTDVGTLTDADVMPLRDIRPGMNVWLPMFDGGTLVHVAGIQVQPGPVPTATLTVDTLARDLLEVSQIMERNAESRRNIRREWNSANRPGRPSNNMISRDEFFGQLSQQVELDGDKWTVFPVVAGQQGQVNRVDIRIDPDAAFAVAVFSQRVTRKRLNRRIPNPLAEVSSGTEAWYEKDSNADLFEGRNLLYAAGTYEQPCGYWPRKHTNDRGETTSHAVTGRWVDDSPWPYICDPAAPAVIWVAIYPDRDCHVNRGQVLYAQEDDVV